MLERNTHIPMYEQIVQAIKKDIKEQKYEAGFIGTQQDLSKRFHVSQITVRKALELLMQEGLVYSKQGKGIYLKRNQLSERLDKLTGISNIMKSKNLSPQVAVRSITQMPTPDYFDEEIIDKMGKECLLIERVHALDDTVIAYAKLYLPLTYGSQFTKGDYEAYTIYQLYQNKLHVKLGKGVQNIRAIPAGGAQAQALGVTPGCPLLFIERYSYSAAGELIEVMELFYEYSKYYFHVELNLSAE